MDRAKSFYRSISGSLTNNSLCPNLSYKTRILGFILTFVIGAFMVISSLGQLFSLALGGQNWFAIWYSIGNVVCLSATFFLMGPQKQWELMMEPGRYKVSLVLIISMISSLLLGLLGISKILTMFSIIVQFCALIWYILSYIPMGRSICGGCLKTIIKSASGKEMDLV